MDQSPSSAFGRAAADRACVFWSFLLSLLQGNAVLLQDTNLLIHLVIALVCISLDELVSDAIAVLTPPTNDWSMHCTQTSLLRVLPFNKAPSVICNLFCLLYQFFVSAILFLCSKTSTPGVRFIEYLFPCRYYPS